MEQNFFFTIIVCKLSVKRKYLKRHIKDCFNINGKQKIKMPKKGEFVKFKNFEKN